ncbi:MAG TPA: PBP1A family penicillin-binding protein [Thermoanaerobaculia bacterium]|nr:PBP1A family penicillin-binding protein [Thermoanaerobaculia bacterium]
MAAARRPKTPPAKPWRLRKRLWAVVFLAVLVGVGIFVIRPFWRLAGQFDDLTFRQPSRLYARATRLYEGRSYPAEALIEDLEGEGYREDPGSSALPAGRYRRTKRGVMAHLRSFPQPDGRRGGGIAEVAYRGNRVSGLRLDGKEVDIVTLEPPLLASYYGPDNQERRPVTVKEVSKDLVDAVLAAEDDSFYSHAGISFSGILRALWVNLQGGQVRQGGSTLTQQLVKNLYLTHERTVSRKSQEVILALLLEIRYTKAEILEAYLNEIYLGGTGGVSLLGVGAASRAYFGKDASQLDLSEAATLAGIIRSPANYSPLIHPERAKARRDLVLQRLAKLERVEPDRIEQALRQPVAVAPERIVRRRAPYFADAAALEAQRRFGIEDLADGGYVLFSTIDWHNQQAAQRAVAWGLEKAEAGYQKGRKGSLLQAALVSIDPKTGGILTYIGGRGYEESQFDRAGRALRQAGSAFKPIVYAAAFETKKASPARFLEDSPLTLKLAGRTWSPKNDDGSFHGWVSVRSALEKSYNPATTRLALEVGMEPIVKLAHDMGITSPMRPFPSLALGAAEVTPVELGTVYATLAAGGVRPPVHGIAAALDRYGKPVQGTDLPEPERVLSPQTAYLVTSLLQGVLERGTARGAAAGLKGDLAGKTGTTNKRRDSWFAGYSPERATVVWVGYDDNSTTRLSGARAALPIWVRFTTQVAPRAGYSTFSQPPGITTATIDPSTGLLATEYCPAVLTEVFRQGEAPTEVCDRHWSGSGSVQVAEVGDGDEEIEDGEGGAATAEAREERAGETNPKKRHPFRRWLKKVFGSEDDKDRKDRNAEDGGDRPPA